MAILYFVWGIFWYWTIIAGVLAVATIPILHEWLTRVFRRRRLEHAVTKIRRQSRHNSKS